MVSSPDWVKKLTPAGPQGSELLKHERDQSNISVDKLAELLHTKEVLERQDRILSLIQHEEVFDKSQNHSLGRVERVKKALARAKRLEQLKRQHNWSEDDFLMANNLISEPTPYGLHASMFLVRGYQLRHVCIFVANCAFLTGCLGHPPKSRYSGAAQALLGAS